MNLPAVGDDDWEALVLRAERPVLVDFHAPWCAPCRPVADLVSELAAARGGALTALALDIDRHPRTAARYEILSLPTVMLFVAGSPQARLTGRIRATALAAAVDPYLDRESS